METKSLLFGLIGFMFGGLVVSVAALEMTKSNTTEMPMSQMTQELKQKTGDEYDKAFISYMTEHHNAAVEMAKLSKDRAKHSEIKDLSLAIIDAQENEISEMKQWQVKWGYAGSEMSHPMNH